MGKGSALAYLGRSPFRLAGQVKKFLGQGFQGARFHPEVGPAPHPYALYQSCFPYGTDDWEGYPAEVAKYLEGEKAKQYPFWVTTGRAQTIWQTAYHDRHLPEKAMALPLPYVEVNPEDAKRLGLQSGDLVEVYNEEGNGTFMVYVTDAVKPGMLFLVMYHWRGTSNSLVSGYTDPKTTIPWYKGTRAALRKVAGAIPSVQQTASLLQQNKFD